MIYGNTEGIKNSTLDELEKIYDIRVSKESICSREIVEVLSRITTYLNRELSLAIDKRGIIVSISVGDSSTVSITEIEGNQNKLCGIRIVHTHPNGDSRLSEIDISALVKLRLDCIAAIGVDKDGITGITIGFCKVKDGEVISEVSEKLTLEDAVNFNIVQKVNEIEKSMNDEYVLQEAGERALLVGTDTEDSLDELKELAKACNVNVLEKILQKRDTIDTAFYVGKGKVSEIALIAQLSGANIVIFDDELSGSQVRNLEENLGIKVIDRTTLILHIFASRARSKESKLQVELAQLKYRLARLSGLGIVLSRTGGGIGTRGPGEKKLETDRRHIREKIYEISKELKKIKQVRKTQRKKRDEINKVSLVGYTNSGKSTLRNKLCEVAVTRENVNKEKVFEADMLFATLDTTTRAVELEDGRTIAVTDTVGFIKKLPHDLVEAFKSTLEEVQYADLLLHVVDASSDYAEEQIDAVNEVLSELDVNDKPVLIVLNKIDKLEDTKLSGIKDRYKNSNAIFISAKYGTNLDELLKRVLEMLPHNIKKAEYLIPYTEQSAVSFIHKYCKVKNEDYREDGTYVNALVDEKTYNKFKKFIINPK
ncbi:MULTISPECIES: GTPase HflX [Clostridium]|uniref:GTPase HflX n=3 Tax=Clostridium TaxID=1485 RepID=D8GRR8_CLOLD|nr:MULTISPECIES: GTPase HflX [Clostridium]ADK16436.1 putative GTP-binding protein [Clostridium ljungdahlii DSM 13528]AGY75514.1 GTPase HflX [Clostridium autoethanogenum DSM 10061]ALU35680.1 GTP-binding protein hflX [Clostridium autoethanogenum DSM 10061]OAA89688.1 GTPase HflX [Clostridium ljungdahlii DSM 13528]OVY52258.1 GTPase HflX [Clostridium autoethanogenum]